MGNVSKTSKDECVACQALPYTVSSGVGLELLIALPDDLSVLAIALQEVLLQIAANSAAALRLLP